MSFERSNLSLPTTEQRNSITDNLDAFTPEHLVSAFLHEEQFVLKAIEQNKSLLEKMIKTVARSFQKGGRLIYVGAGTSGRIGTLDAAECLPTFGVGTDQILCLMAGGSKAFFQSIEGAEDHFDLGRRDILKLKLTPNDVAVGISASGTAPFVLGALRAAKQKKSKVFLITSNFKSSHTSHYDGVLEVITGPEVLSGSTRLKAGTAAKIILNTLTTSAMTLCGKVYGNMMVDMVCSNQKLFERGIQMVRDICGTDFSTAKSLLMTAKKNVKTAVLMHRLDLNVKEAEQKLKVEPSLRLHFKKFNQKNQKIKWVIFDMDGTIVRYDLPKGFSTWAALGHAYGLYPQMEAWIQAYKQKKISYNQIWRNCAKALKNKPILPAYQNFFPLKDTPPLLRGFDDCMEVFNHHYQTGIISSGISTVARHLRNTYNMDFEISNHFETKNHVFTGKIDINVHYEKKSETFKKICKQKNIDPAQVCYVGDSPQDIGILKEVAFPVAIRASDPKLLEACKGVMISDFHDLLIKLQNF